MTLSDDLKALANNVYEDDQGSWRTYVIDHIAQIQANAKHVYADTTYINRYRYDVEWFLRSLSVGPELAWIFLLINNLNSSFDFDKEGGYYIPSATYIEQLHDKYSGTSVTRIHT